MADEDISPPSVWRRITYCLPLIVALVVAVTYFIFYKEFLFCSATNPCSPLNAAEVLSGVSTADPVKVASYVARASWTLISGVHVLACLVTIVTASLVIYRVLSVCEYRVEIRWITILIVVGVAADVSLVVALLTAHDTYSPAQQLLRATVGQVLPWINKFNRFGDALSLTGTICLAAAACATLWHKDVNKEFDETQLMQRVRLLRPVLYVGAATLVIAVLRLSAMHAWAISYLPPDGELGKSVASLTSGIVGTLGTLLTLLLAGIYLPAIITLRARLRELAAKEPDPEAWMAQHGVGLSLPQFLPRVVALLAPLLAGPLGDILVRATASLGG